MDKSYIEQYLVVDRFVQGTLTDSETAEFEERLVWDKALLDELKLVQRLRDGLCHSMAENPEALEPLSVGERIAEFFAVPQFAAAASFLLAVTLMSTFWLKLPVPGNNVINGQTGVTNVLRLEAVRSTSVTSVNVDAGAWIVFLVDAPLGSTGDYYDTYRVTIRRDEAGADPIWMQDELIPTYEDSLAIGLAGTAMPTGRYVLSIEASENSEPYDITQEIHFQTTSPH